MERLLAIMYVLEGFTLVASKGIRFGVLYSTLYDNYPLLEEELSDLMREGLSADPPLLKEVRRGRHAFYSLTNEGRSIGKANSHLISKNEEEHLCSRWRLWNLVCEAFDEMRRNSN